MTTYEEAKEKLAEEAQREEHERQQLMRLIVGGITMAALIARSPNSTNPATLAREAVNLADDLIREMEKRA